MGGQLRYDDRVVIITGAGAGLGRAYALLFASRGASVVVNDLGVNRHGDGSSTKSADAVVQEIRQNGGKAVANYDSVLDGGKIVKTAVETFGRIDVVINNAGILRDTSFMKMTDTQWDTIHDVHLKGSMITTRAAWPYFIKQKYGRVILTSSNSGLYGNFGQSNYSAAKLGLVGLANTLAIEGERKNIYTNVIVPTAASRLTQDVIPPDFFDQLKPELIAPVVFWLCHKDCMENGSIIESALGWAGKYHIVRSSGCVLRQNVSADVTPEAVQENWSKVVDMTSAKHLSSIQEATGELMNINEDLKNGVPAEKGFYVMKSSYNHRDAILYALGIGATVQEPTDIRYLYENYDGFAVFPTYYVLYGPMACMSSTLLQDSLPNADMDPTKILHGEQYLEIYKQLPIDGVVETRFKIQDVLDKGKGLVVLVQHETYSADGEKLSSGQMSAFIIGAGGLQGKRSSPHAIPTVNPPARNPDKTVTQQTNVDQAALYRLSGDLNPLHIDAELAAMAGFKRPILHGLCSLGFSTRHVLQTYAAGDPSLFKSIKVRFAKPVLPGQTLRTDMWRNGNRIHFQTSIVETGVLVVTGAYIDLLDIKMGLKPNLCSGETDMQSDAIFAAIGEHVKSNPDQAKKLNAIFLYNITIGGNPTAEWTLDLKNGEVHKGKPKSGKADATLTVEDADMVAIALGKLNPQVAFMRGKLKITGNIMLTQRLKSLMETSKAKL